MCTGGRLLADVTVGFTERPDVPPRLESSLTTATDGRWVLWAHKVARPEGKLFCPLTAGTPYPADAIAECCRGQRHDAPDPACSCGFHALSTHVAGFGRQGFVHLEVALTGRVLVFEWSPRDVLFRAERQTVARVHRLGKPFGMWQQPPDAAGGLAHMQEDVPAGSGPMRLDLPTAPPPVVNVDDDIGLCVLAQPEPARASAVLVPS